MLLLPGWPYYRVAGMATAWLVTTFQFPGRNTLCWLLPLPLAIPIYIVAYVYVDIFDAAGPLQKVLRGLFGWRARRTTGFPPIRSLPRRYFCDRASVLYPYV